MGATPYGFESFRKAGKPFMANEPQWYHNSSNLRVFGANSKVLQTNIEADQVNRHCPASINAENRKLPIIWLDFLESIMNGIFYNAGIIWIYNTTMCK